MKKLMVMLGVLALATALPAFAAENAAPPVPALSGIVSSPVCAPAVTTPAAAAQGSQVPSWLIGTRQEIQLAGCASYCAECGGCCAILGPNLCACC